MLLVYEMGSNSGSSVSIIFTVSLAKVVFFYRLSIDFEEPYAEQGVLQAVGGGAAGNEI